MLALLDDGQVKWHQYIQDPVLALAADLSLLQVWTRGMGILQTMATAKTPLPPPQV